MKKIHVKYGFFGNYKVGKRKGAKRIRMMIFFKAQENRRFSAKDMGFVLCFYIH